MGKAAARAGYGDWVSAGGRVSSHGQVHIGSAGTGRGNRSGTEADGDTGWLAGSRQRNGRRKATGDGGGDHGIAALSLI